MRAMAFAKATEDSSMRPFPATRRRPTIAALGGFTAGLAACTALACTALACLAGAGPAAANPAAPYPRMAPVDAYLMDRAQEIALAKSAAPDSISKDATILVMTRAGYETAVTGTNGFVCWVGRGFSGASDWAERWNPKVRAAECENPPAARSVFPIVKLRTAMILAGRSDAETIAGIKAALRRKQIPPLQSGAMSYMMSKSSYLSDGGDHDMPHLMFFAAVRNGAGWGANAADSPVVGVDYWFFTPGKEADAANLPPLSVFLIGVATWSDGTPAQTHKM